MTDQSIPQKKCTACKENKPHTEYFSNKGKPDDLSTECKKCSYTRTRKYITTPKGKASYEASQLKYRNSPKNRAAQRRYRLLRRYGVTSAEYDKMLQAQKGLCAICGTAPSDKPLAVDHNHQTGNVRALLCHSCNAGIGYFKESPDRLIAAIEYLRRHS